MSNKLLVTNKTQLLDENGDTLRISKEQLQTMMNKKITEKDLEIKKAYKEFLAEKDVDLDHFEFSSIQVLIKLFMFKEKRGVMDKEGNAIVNTTIFPVAKVVKAGNESKYSPGDFVKLKDYEACEIVNPNYELWIKNGQDKGNLTKIGEAPPATLNNFINLHGKKAFNPDPIKADVTFEDFNLFVVHDPNIECHILDPSKLLK